MAFQFHPYSIPLFISFITSGLLALILYKDLTTKGVGHLFTILIGLAMWSGTYLMQWIVMSDRMATFFLLHTFIGVYIAVHGLLFFTLSYIEASKKIRTTSIVFLGITSTVLLLFLISNNLHQLTIPSAHLELRSGNLELVYERGPLYIILGIIYPGIISLITLLILIVEYFRSPSYNKPRIFLIIIGTLVPWFFSILSLSPFNLNPNQDLAPLGIPFTAAILTLAIYRYNILEFMPIISGKIVNDFPDGVLILDDKGKILEMNPIAQKDYSSFVEIGGMYNDKISLKNLMQNELREKYEAQMKENKKFITLTGRLNNNKYYDIRISQLLNKKNIAMGSLVIYRDITEMEAAKDDLKKTNLKLLESNKTKNLLFKIISHDLRGPIGSLRSLVEMMCTDDHNITQAQRTNLEMIYKTSDSVYKLLTNLLDWSKTQMDEIILKFNQNLVSNTIDEVINQLKPIAELKQITLYNHSKQDITAYYDDQSVMIVLRNILSNAIKFSMKDSIIDINVNRHKLEVIINITDYGMGMDSKTLESINKKQFVTSSQGTLNEMGSGLGLVLSHDLIALNNGTINVSSTPGKGTTFQISIPAND